MSVFFFEITHGLSQSPLRILPSSPAHSLVGLSFRCTLLDTRANEQSEPKRETRKWCINGQFKRPNKTRGWIISVLLSIEIWVKVILQDVYQIKNPLPLDLQHPCAGKTHRARHLVQCMLLLLAVLVGRPELLDQSFYPTLCHRSLSSL